MVIIPLVERLTRRALTAQGVRSRWVETSVARLHAYDAKGAGRLPTMVVLHGISSSAAAFAPLLTRLRPRARRVLAPEAPGHGFSDPPAGALTVEALMEAMTELLDRELDEPAVICGNSLGGAVALRYALTRPERVRGLVLTSPAGASMEQAELEALLATFRMRSSADGQAFLTRLNGRRPWFAPLLGREIVGQFARAPIVALTGGIRQEHGFTPEELGGLKMPILVWWGRGDQLLPASNLAYYRRHLPAHARIEEPEALGHCPHMDAPGRLARAITDFAGEIVRGPKAAI